MSTSAQINANQQNAQLSSGPKTELGKAISALNNFRHGFTGAFCILDWENEQEYDLLYGGLLDDHRPSNTTERLLVKTMAQSYWLRQRSLTLQEMCFDPARPMCRADFEKDLALYLRYQTTHDRAFTKALDQLQKLRADKRKQEKDEAALSQQAEKARIGFESQQRKEAEQKAVRDRCEAQEKRREAAEHRAQELHQSRVRLTEARAQRQDTEAAIAKVVRMPRSVQENAELATKTAA